MCSTEQIAQERSCDSIVVVMMAEKGTVSFLKQGFVPVKTIYYRDYRDPVTGKAIFDQLNSETKCCTVAIKFLKNFQSSL